MTKSVLAFLAVSVYVLSAGSTYMYFAKNSSPSKPAYVAPGTTSNGEVVDSSPKTEECPMNGMMYSKAKREKWEKRRPLGIMVQNNLEARPQSGLSSADVVHEAVAEGGITRFLTIFYCEDAKIIGSVRSARIYFIKMLQGFGEFPLYAHVGGANTPGPADALGMIRKLGWYGYNDMDQFAVPFPNYWRDYDRLPGRATEHTVYTSTEKLWAYAAKQRELTNKDEEGELWNATWKGWKFEDDAAEAKRGTVNAVNFGFWTNSLASDYKVSWLYDRTTNSYRRMNGGKPHTDLNTKKQLTTKNVVVVFADESVANDGYEGGEHMLYDVIGKGDAIMFHNGASKEVEWRKADEEDMMRFYEEGKELAFVRGKIWIEILPTGNKVDYKKS